MIATAIVRLAKTSDIFPATIFSRIANTTQARIRKAPALSAINFGMLFSPAQWPDSLPISKEEVRMGPAIEGYADARYLGPLAKRIEM